MCDGFSRDSGLWSRLSASGGLGRGPDDWEYNRRQTVAKNYRGPIDVETGRPMKSVDALLLSGNRTKNPLSVHKSVH